ncbi:tyrosine-type recombinase/integrase [Vibrio parahaemolyticus]
MARPRKDGNKNLPENLYSKFDKRTGKTYYQYKDPRSKSGDRVVWHSFGTDRESAVSDALALNAAFYESRLNRINRILDMNPMAITQLGVTAKSFGERQLKEVERRYSINELTKSSFNEKTRYIKLFISRMGSKRMKEITVRDVALVLEEYVNEDKLTTAKLIRSSWGLLFKEAQQSGDVDTGFNPAASTKPIRVRVKRSRLKVDDFYKVYNLSKAYKPQYVNQAIKLAITTGLRRTDVASLMFRYIKDDHLYMATSKSGKQVVIAFPLKMKSPLLEQSLGEIISECRGKALSPYIIHVKDRGAKAKVGSQVDPRSLSNHFAALIKSANVTVENGKTPPTFHELRALAAKSYRNSSAFDEIQDLLGHKSKEMTDVYLDERTHKVIYVKVG